MRSTHKQLQRPEDSARSNFFRFMLVIWPLKPKKMTEISYNTIGRLGSVADKKLSKNREGT
jgi:hypothetical protein